MANTRLPVAAAIWIAVTPMPELPPCTSSDLARREAAAVVDVGQTVKKVSGSDAASTSVRPFGTGSACTSGATQYSA